MTPPPLHRCQNCHCSLPEDANFCDHCGQKRIEGFPTVREVGRDFLTNSWALDSKLLRTMSALLLRPGRLTLAFIQGIRKRYYTPFKLFLFWLTIGFILINSLINLKVSVLKQARTQDIELIASQINIRKGLQQHFQDSSDQVYIDSLLLANSLDNTLHKDTINITDYYRFAIEDLQQKSAKELAQQYETEGFIEALMLPQLIKMVQHPNDLQSYILGRLSWILLLMLPLMALWMRLLYWRKHPYFIQHFVFLLHWHTFLLVLLTLLGGLFWSDIISVEQLYTLRNAIGVAGVVYVFWSMRVVYQQSWIKTSIKFFLFLIGYMLSITLATLLFFTISFLLF